MDLVEGENVREEIDKLTGHSHKIVIEPIGADRRIPTIVVRSVDKKAPTERRYQLAIGSHLMVAEGDTVNPGDVLAKIPRETTKTKDITGGLPRVVELFEARRPKDAAVVSEISGVVHVGEATRGTRKVTVEGKEGTTREYTIPKVAHLIVQDGEWVATGESLTDGPVDPHDVLAVLGEAELQRYLVDKIQEVYRTQGVTINDKHIETIVRQMCRFVKVTDPGDTEFLLEEQVPRYRVEEENERIEKLGGQPARFAPVLLGITKAALATESFVSAASFQETTRVLTEAAVSGRVDDLYGLKENVIVGRLIPAGTGAKHYHYFTVDPVAARGDAATGGAAGRDAGRVRRAQPAVAPAPREQLTVRWRLTRIFGLHRRTAGRYAAGAKHRSTLGPCRLESREETMPTIAQLVRHGRQTTRGQDQEPGSHGVPAEARRVHARVHHHAQEAELGAAEGGARASDQRRRGDDLHPGRGPQPAGALGGPDPWRSREGPPGRSLPRHSRRGGRPGGGRAATRAARSTVPSGRSSRGGRSPCRAVVT